MSFEDLVLKIISDHQGASRKTILDYCNNPPNTIDKAIGSLKRKGFIVSSLTRPVKYSLTKKGERYCKDKFKRPLRRMTFSHKEVLKKKDEFLESFKQEIRNQIILDEDLLEIVTVLPFCRGRCARNKMGLLAHFIGDYGRGKDMLHEVYRDVMDSRKIDCRGFFTEGREKLRELKNIVGSYPDILFVDEIGILHGNPRLAYQSYLDNKDFPVIFLGNPETSLDNFMNAKSFGHIIEKSTKTGRSVLDRVHLWVFWPPLSLEEKKKLSRVIFNRNHENLAAISNYLRFAFENCDPEWTTKAQDCLDTILDNAEKLLKDHKASVQGHENMISKYVIEKQGKGPEKWIDLSNHIEGARFQIALMSLSRALAMRDLRDKILADDVMKALKIKFNFLEKIYKGFWKNNLIDNLTKGIKKEDDKKPTKIRSPVNFTKDRSSVKT